MKKILALSLISIFAMMSFSPAASAAKVKQTNVTIAGKVIDQSGAALEFATVSLERLDSTIVTGTTTANDGSYTMSATAGTYTLAVRMIGYKDNLQQISVSGSNLNIAPITLVEDAEMLAGATVTEKVKLVEMKVDKLVMNISQSAYAQGSNALDLIKKAPGVTIDKDGNVTLNGQAVQVWIDGRPSYVSGKSLEALLRSTDGGSIDKFEIMAHPSAKYDAEGQGGIINIKTKRNALEGLNGNIGAEGSGMYFGETERFLAGQSAWANFNYRAGKSRTFVNLYEAVQNFDQLETVDNVIDGEGYNFGQQSESLLKFNSANTQIKLGQDWFVNDKNTLGFIVTVPGNKSGYSTDRDWSWAKTMINGEQVKYSETDIDTRDKAVQASGNLNYTHVFDPMKAKEVTFNADYYRMSDRMSNNTITYTQLEDWTKSIRDISTDRDIDIYSAKADYQSVVFDKYMFEAGAKWALSKTGNEMIHAEDALRAETLFDYDENVTAAYADIAGSFKEKFSMKVGLRAEYTSSNGNWISAGEVSKKDYLDFFPTVYVGYAGEKNRYSISYTRRITRPSYSQLNPTKQYVDANNYIQGNPELTPQYTDAVTFQAGFGQHLSVAALYNRIGDYIMQTPSFGLDGSEIFTWNNFGSMTMSGLAINVTELPLAKWLTWTASINALYTWNNASMDSYTSSAPLAQAYTCFTALLGKDWKVQLDGTASSSVAAAYFKTDPVFVSNIAVKKTLLDNRMTLTFAVDDLFRSSVSNVRVNNMDGVKSFVGQTPYMQAVKLGLDWSFGKAHQTRARNVGNLEEISRTGNSSSAGAN